MEDPTIEYRAWVVNGDLLGFCLLTEREEDWAIEVKTEATGEYRIETEPTEERARAFAQEKCEEWIAEAKAEFVKEHGPGDYDDDFSIQDTGVA